MARSVVVDSFLLLLSLYVGVAQYLVSFLVLTLSHECLFFYFVSLLCLHVVSLYYLFLRPDQIVTKHSFVSIIEIP